MQQRQEHRFGRRAVALLLALAASAPLGTSARSVGEGQQKLRIRNRTPFILILYVSGVRVGWVKPFRSETVRGLREGYHDVYATSRYGSGYFGPQRTWVPGNWNITPTAGGVSEDAAVALSGRIYRQNRASLAACDALARRRGEELRGLRAELEVKVDKEGRGVVAINGAGLPERLRSCYAAVSRTWSLPNTGEQYIVTLQHLVVDR